jgi:hypothetical protein
MKKNQNILIKLILLSLLAYSLFLIGTKQKETFFDKNEACSIINRDKAFIDGQVSNVSNSISSLQTKIGVATGILRELFDFLRLNNCFSMTKTDTRCRSLWTTYQNATDKLQPYNDLVDGNCLTQSSNFICSELRSQYTLHRTTTRNTQTDQQNYNSFFSSRRGPQDSINAIRANAC